MLHKSFVTAFMVLFALFAAPTMGETDIPSNVSVLESEAVDYARGGSKGQNESRLITRKKAQVVEETENVDCFYEHNRNSPDCSSSKSVER